MHGQNQRRGDSRKQQVSRLVSVPVTRRTAPSHGQYPVKHLRETVFGAVAERSKIRNKSGKPEEQRDREVSRDREHVPDQRAPELWPYPHGERQREEPIGRQPGTP